MSHSSITHVSQTTLNAGSGSPEFSHGLDWALARKGVTVKDKKPLETRVILSYNRKVQSQQAEFPFMLGGVFLGQLLKFPSHNSVNFSNSQGVVDAVGLGAQGNSGLIAADIERSSLIICGKASADTSGIKEALAALSGPIIAARGGVPLLAR